ncbi:hypothetical protein IAQ61_004665 [Plenodomus lingam]|uniref:uncharacterized protein n=1 Tax=Leptosphaeria maculans TaxID=5022 RepID=UPI00331F1AD1|nr:hypothetical protein IAQ61_004665 [Plenodomus lingam]
MVHIWVIVAYPSGFGVPEEAEQGGSLISTYLDERQKEDDTFSKEDANDLACTVQASLGASV